MEKRLVAIVAVAIVLAGCAEPRKPAPVERAARTGSPFDAIGRVTLHPGQPCTSQIMFDFRTGSSNPVWLAAPMPESKILTEAAGHGRRVHISGKWQRGRHSGCTYVEVIRVD